HATLFRSRPARRDLGRGGPLVDPPFAARLELEVLDRVGEVDPVPVDARLLDRPGEHPPGRPDERGALPVLLITGLFADEHERCIGRPGAEYGLGSVAVEGAPLAPARGLPQRGQARLTIRKESLISAVSH